MSDQTEQPEWAKQLAEAGKHFVEGLNKVGHQLNTQAALGWVLQGNEAKAREQLASLPGEYVKFASIAARALADLADEDVAGRG